MISAGGLGHGRAGVADVMSVAVLGGVLHGVESPPLLIEDRCFALPFEPSFRHEVEAVYVPLKAGVACSERSTRVMSSN